MQTKIDLDIFKSYDIRGIYPSELNESAAELIGRAFVQFWMRHSAGGRMMRASSRFGAPQHSPAGVTAAGADVVDLGLTSTDELYFAVGKYGYPAGAMITASHNPKEYNGFKLCRENAIALSAETGVFAIRDLVAAGAFEDASQAGRITQLDALPDFTDHCLSFIDRAVIKPLKLVIDCGNGMGGLIVPAIFKHLPVEVIPLTSTSTARSRIIPRARSNPRTCSTSSARSESTARISARPSTATQIACSSRTNAASWSAATWSPRWSPKCF